jgi:hypothetical protein
MMNKHKPHVLVLPEDDANRQIANGFRLDRSVKNSRIQVLRPADGWIKVLESFENNHVNDLRKFLKRMLILIIDFDQNEGRLIWAQAQIPDDLKDRVFIIGARKDPETMKRNRPAGLRSYEEMGLALARDCQGGTRTIWNHPDLACNLVELERMMATVRPCLFD